MPIRGETINAKGLMDALKESGNVAIDRIKKD